MSFSVYEQHEKPREGGFVHVVARRAARADGRGAVYRAADGRRRAETAS